MSQAGNEDSTAGRAPTISIHGVEIARIEYLGEQVVTFAQVDRVHERPEGTAGRTFREHRSRFVEDEDFIELTSDELRRMCQAGVFPERSARGILITKRGYLKLVKPMSDDRAWAVQGEMIDRYFAAEAGPERITADPADPRTLLAVFTHLQERVDSLSRENAELKPAAAALDRIAEAHGSFCRSTAAKNLQIAPHTLIRWMRTNGWTFRRPGDKDDLAYQSKIAGGLLEHKITTGQRPDGSEWSSTQVRVTPKGMTVLGKAFPPPLAPIAA